VEQIEIEAKKLMADLNKKAGAMISLCQTIKDVDLLIVTEKNQIVKEYYISKFTQIVKDFDKLTKELELETDKYKQFCKSNNVPVRLDVVKLNKILKR